MPVSRPPISSLALTCCALLLPACGTGERTPTPAVGSVVNVVARGLTFEAPDTIPSGWTTFRFDNQAPMVHFVQVERLPEGITIKEQQELVAPVFQEGYRLLAAGQTDSAMAAFGTLPEWFGQIIFVGGPGLTAGGLVSEATVHLEPGTYLLECYVKTGGVFHSFNPAPPAYGMVHQFTVTDSVTEAPEPTTDLQVTLSSARGIEVSGVPVAGPQTIAVTFEDQKVHENFVGNDLHLARLGDGADISALAAWMDWRFPGGLETPAPVQFLGGIQDMPAGATGYFKVILSPGEYAWVSEVANPDQKGMLKTFGVSEDSPS